METDAQLPANGGGGDARGAGMSPAELVAALRDPARYPHPAEAVELMETHISWVFLAGDYAYKIKKPVNLGFLDFSTLKARRFYCEEELRLNRRTAPGRLTPFAAIIVFALPRALRAVSVMSRARPALPPAGYVGWPLWYHRACLEHNQRVGGCISWDSPLGCLARSGRFDIDQQTGPGRDYLQDTIRKIGTCPGRPSTIRLPCSGYPRRSGRRR